MLVHMEVFVFISFGRTEKYLLEGEKKRSRQRLEAIRDPDFQKYVELGKAADFVVLDQDLALKAVFVDGERVV